MTRADPHEAQARRPEFEKDAAAEALLAAVNDVLASAPLPPPSEVGDHPIVYVVGAPRSGTTLAHQLVARHLPLGYIDNVVARFWLRPSVGIALSQEVFGKPGTRRFELRSRHGVTDDAGGPHEFGYFWRHWLRLDESPTHHLDESAQARVDAEGLRGALVELLSAFGGPIVFKNVICGFHAGLLTAIHPRSLFVHVVRDTDAVARSILHTRFERYGSYETWWSLKPSTWPFAELSAAAAVVRQALDCRAEITEELDGADIHAIEVEYARVCADPAAFLGLVAHKLAALGAEVRVTGDVPAKLSASPGPELPPWLGEEIRTQVLSSR